jgi:hypothetical protein
MVNRAAVITLIVLASAATISLPLTLPILGFQYTFWRMHLILDNVTESELIERTKDLPEVKAFLAEYENGTTYIDTDYHIGVVYSITECELTGKSCSVARPYAAYLHIRISLDTGYPEYSRFACDGGDYGKAPLGNEGLIQAIKECNSQANQAL